MLIITRTISNGYTRERCRGEMTNPETQHDRLVNTLKQMRIDNPGIAEIVAKVIVSEQKGDEWLKQIFNGIRETKMYNSYPESLNDYDRIMLTFFANAERMKAQFHSSRTKFLSKSKYCSGFSTI
jgi:hypothetical protein